MRKREDPMNIECVHSPSRKHTSIGRFMDFLFNKIDVLSSNYGPIYCAKCGSVIDLPNEYFRRTRGIFYFILSTPFHIMMTIWIINDYIHISEMSFHVTLFLLASFFVPVVLERIVNSILLSQYKWNPICISQEDKQDDSFGKKAVLLKHATISRIILLAQFFGLRLIYVLLLSVLICIISSLILKKNKVIFVCTIAVSFILLSLYVDNYLSPIAVNCILIVCILGVNFLGE